MNAYDLTDEPDYAQIFSAFPSLETERLALREIVVEDAPDLLEVFSDDEVTRFYDLYSYKTVEEAKALVNFFAESFETERGIRWAIARKEDNRLIGTCGYVWLRRHRGEIGYELNRAHWRQGYMSEAIHAITQYGFDTLLLNRIEATVMVENQGSAALLKSNGFQEEGIMREFDFFKDAFHDMRLFSLLKKDV